MKNILRRLLLAYRPIDDRLRQVRLYANLSRSLQQRYNVFMASRNISADQDAAGQAYSRNFSTIAPRQDTLLFECYWGKKFGDNPLAIYRALMRSQPANHFRIYWVTSPEGESPPVEITRNPQVILVQTGSREYGIALLEAGYLVNNVTFPPYFIRRPGQRYCNTWHGIPMKAMGRDMAAPLISMANSQRNFLQSDLILESSDYYRWATIRPYCVEQLVSSALTPCGTPRVDDTLIAKLSVDDLRRRYGISQNQKVVLFAPTWRGNSTDISPVFSDQAKLCARIARELGDDHFVLFSAHQMVRVAAADMPRNSALLANGDNINDILSIVDVMISDYSSILFDFLPADRPIVLFTPDIEQYREERGLYLEPADLPCADTRTLPDLIAAIRAGRRPSDFPEYAAMRQRFTPLEDGEAASRALQLLLNPPATAARLPDTRKRLLIAPGGMIPNGITSSLKNLIANLDYDRFDPYILLDASIMDSDPLRMAQFADFDKRCNWILRCGEMLVTAEESDTYQKFRIGTEGLSQQAMETIRTIFSREARRIMGDARFDVAIEFGGYAPYWSALIACSNSARKVCYQHNHLWAEYTNLDVSRNQKQLYGVFQTYVWYDQIVAVSDETRKVNEENLHQFYAPGIRAQTVRNTMDVKRVLDSARLPTVLAHPEAGALFQDKSLFRFIALGRLSPEKRFDRMIGAMARIAPRHPNAVLMICGSGPLQAKLQQHARHLGVSNQVRFMGQVDNPHPLLANADVCVMSSDYEGQPMVLLEALCLGVPCIGSDIPGIRAVLKEGRGHIVAPTEDAFAQAMESAILGTLPKLDGAPLGDEYATATMQEFYEKVCAVTD